MAMEKYPLPKKCCPSERRQIQRLRERFTLKIKGDLSQLKEEISIRAETWFN